MINENLRSQIEKYDVGNIANIKNSIKEVLQNIILCELSRTDFFSFAVFYGGTSLRIFRGLKRFSEDMDFTVIKETDKNLADYLPFIQKSIKSYGLDCQIKLKQKNVNTSVESHYLQFNLKSILENTFPEYADKVNFDELLSIKIELEHILTEGGKIETLLLTYPNFAQIKTYTMDTLFACKILAVLNRKWKSRIKGRDYYDYLFYIQQNVSVNLEFLKNGLMVKEYSIEQLKDALICRFNEVDFQSAIDDIMPFIKNDDEYLLAMNKDIFLATIKLLKASE